MKPKHSIYRIGGLILVGVALFHLIAGLMAVMFWLVTGDWRDFVPHITLMALSLTLPGGYLVWKTYFEEKFRS